jgi:hypothetical protein
MNHAARVLAIISGDPTRWRLLDVVRSMRLPDCWIGAGFVRNAVWDCLHERTSPSLSGDVDVLWFDPGRASPSEDRKIEAVLRTLDPSVEWDVKNQARMHVRNGDAPYLFFRPLMRCAAFRRRPRRLRSGGATRIIATLPHRSAWMISSV